MKKDTKKKKTNELRDLNAKKNPKGGTGTGVAPHGLQAPEADLLSAGQLLFWPERLFDRDRQFVVLRALPVGI